MLDLGVKYNISELVAIKINNHVNKKEFSSAFKLLNNFDSKNSKEFDYVYFEKASYDINIKDYNSAIKNLIYLYNKGYTQLDIQLAYLYIQINDETKALELFKSRMIEVIRKLDMKLVLIISIMKITKKHYHIY